MKIEYFQIIFYSATYLRSELEFPFFILDPCTYELPIIVLHAYALHLKQVIVWYDSPFFRSAIQTQVQVASGA